MIECIFTIDYEIYGNGEGTLRELVLEPARKLNSIFKKAGAAFVLFAETAELEKIETCGADPAVQEVKRQIKEFFEIGHEIALHLHPQWCNASCRNDGWDLDYTEYNLCTLESDRIAEIVDKGIAYLRTILEVPDYTPISFRAGNWLLQPTEAAAKVLAERGIKIDSSVFKGGLQHLYNLDYRRSLANGHYWKFHKDVNSPDPEGGLIEVPIHTQMVPFWKMITPKRVSLQQKGGSGKQSAREKLYRIFDRIRFRQPLKLDFCRMTLNELTNMMDQSILEDRQNPALYRPVVAIGHTKDLVDLNTVELFLKYLEENEIKVTTFQNAYAKLV